MPQQDFASRFSRAKLSMAPLIKDGRNPHFKSTYATLGAVHAVVREKLSEEDIDVLEVTEVRDGVTIQRIVLYDLAEGAIGLVSEMPLVCKDPGNPQQMGSAMTYYRRYLLTAICGLCPEDDDGNAASQPRPTVSPDKEKAREAYKLAQRLCGREAADRAIAGCNTDGERYKKLTELYEERKQDEQ